MLKYLLIFLILAWQDAWPGQSGACSPGDARDRGYVRHVYDGDTVLLEDGRRVRLIGVNAPEIGRDGQPSQPKAKAARDALVRILGRERQIILRYGRERSDRYGRILAHIYLENGLNINAWLVEQGYAAVIAVPPNVALMDCYASAEATARRLERGIWSTGYFDPIPARSLNRKQAGFRLVTGKVRKITHSRRSVWLGLEGKASLRIARKDLVHFGEGDFGSYVGKKVLVRGWARPGRDGPVIQVRHPFALQRLE